MRLSEKQQLFALCVAGLILHAHAEGYAVTFGDAYRDPRVFGQMGVSKGYGARRSNHKQRLAVDLNLFRDGRYLRSTKAHKPLGEWWERHGVKHGLPLRWGGRFGDGNHYEWSDGFRRDPERSA